MNSATEEGGANSTPHKVKVVSPYLSDSAGTGTSQDNEEQQVRTSSLKSWTQGQKAGTYFIVQSKLSLRPLS